MWVVRALGRILAGITATLLGSAARSGERYRQDGIRSAFSKKRSVK